MLWCQLCDVCAFYAPTKVIIYVQLTKEMASHSAYHSGPNIFSNLFSGRGFGYDSTSS